MKIGKQGGGGRFHHDADRDLIVERNIFGAQFALHRFRDRFALLDLIDGRDEQQHKL